MGFQNTKPKECLWWWIKQKNSFCWQSLKWRKERGCKSTESNFRHLFLQFLYRHRKWHCTCTLANSPSHKHLQIWFSASHQASGDQKLTVPTSKGRLWLPSGDGGQSGGALSCFCTKAGGRKQSYRPRVKNWAEAFPEMDSLWWSHSGAIMRVKSCTPSHPSREAEDTKEGQDWSLHNTKQ